MLVPLAWSLTCRETEHLSRPTVTEDTVSVCLTGCDHTVVHGCSASGGAYEQDYWFIKQQ